GQYIQQGLRNIFETVINISKPKVDININKEDENTDGLNYLAGRSMDFVNKRAFMGTVLAHVDGGVPNLIINVPEISDYYFGKTVY
ncbi:MAG TPA: glucose-6-phosphate isomerase, partial [Clostridiaceae bacterium]|nr:glucose-6-phosphate isomerase [Clostridiaceae bacterium]